MTLCNDLGATLFEPINQEEFDKVNEIVSQNKAKGQGKYHLGIHRKDFDSQQKKLVFFHIQ